MAPVNRQAPKIALIGATGTVGRLLAAALTTRAVAWRALVRDPPRARGLLGTAGELAAADLARPETLPGALEGVERLYLATDVQPDTVALQRAAIRAAREAGVRHVVKLSNLGADPRSDFLNARWHGESERELEASGLAWTFLRPHYFMDNLLVYAPALKAGGELFGPAPATRISPIDARDIAAVGAAALCEPGHEGCAYDLTGPAGVSFGEIAAGVSTALGRPVRVVALPPAEMRRRLVAAGRPDWYAGTLALLYGMYEAGGWDAVSDAVARVRGRPPIAFPQFLADHARAFREA